MKKAALAVIVLFSTAVIYFSATLKPIPVTKAIPVVGTVQSKAGPDYIYPIVPGVVNASLTDPQTTICNPKWSTSSIRPSTNYTSKVKVTKLQDYNSHFGTHYALKDGELDHLISIELLGDPASADNLWFEPYITQVNGQTVGAHQKDLVENRLKSEVCSGTMTIKQAQIIITTDWYAYYKNRLTQPSFGSVVVADPDDY